MRRGKGKLGEQFTDLRPHHHRTDDGIRLSVTEQLHPAFILTQAQRLSVGDESGLSDLIFHPGSFR